MHLAWILAVEQPYRLQFASIMVLIVIKLADIMHVILKNNRTNRLDTITTLIAMP